MPGIGSVIPQKGFGYLIINKTRGKYEAYLKNKP